DGHALSSPRGRMSEGRRKAPSTRGDRAPDLVRLTGLPHPSTYYVRPHGVKTHRAATLPRHKSLNRKKVRPPMAAPQRQYLFTSESVTEGHPDKIADQISDGVLDAVMAADPTGRVA